MNTLGIVILNTFLFLNWFQEVNVNSLAEMPNPMKRGGGRGVQQPVERKRQKF